MSFYLSKKKSLPNWSGNCSDHRPPAGHLSALHPKKPRTFSSLPGAGGVLSAWWVRLSPLISATSMVYIFVIYFSGLNFTFSSRDAFFSISLCVGRYWGRRNEGNHRAYRKPKSHAASAFPWLPMNQRKLSHGDWDGGSYLPRVLADSLKQSDPEPGAQHCLRTATCHTAFERERVHSSIT